MTRQLAAVSADHSVKDVRKVSNDGAPALLARLMDRLQHEGLINTLSMVETPSLPPSLSKVTQLPIWPDSMRGIPNAILRSPIFGAVKRGPRAFIQRKVLATFDGLVIVQTGPQLDQTYLDVWLQCMHLARASLLGTRIMFTANSFLRAINRGTGKSQHEWLRNALTHLASTVVEIKEGSRLYSGPLLHDGIRDEKTGQYYIRINPSIVSLYDVDNWTQVDFEQRNALKGQPLAQWLYGFYASHAKAHPLKVATLHRLCGSKNSQMFGFRRELREALKKLRIATGWDCGLDDSDKVHIIRTPSGSQGRHLTRKALKSSQKKHGITHMPSTAQSPCRNGTVRIQTRHKAHVS